MSRLKLGDKVRVKASWYNNYPKDSNYNLPKDEDGEIVEYYSDSSIVVRYGINITPPVNGNGFDPIHESPVRTETVTTRRIVPGVYGRVRVNDEGKVGRVGLWLEGHYLNAEELDSLAMVASQLAEALRDAKA